MRVAEFPGLADVADDLRHLSVEEILLEPFANDDGEAWQAVIVLLQTYTGMHEHVFWR